MGPAELDVVTIGRSSVDLYGQQIGSRLEDIGSFAKSVGGCPANIAIGCARLGLKSALLSRVGDEQMGRFIREQMAREGVAPDGLKVDPERLTALVLLSVEDESTFPLIFYRENCADMALSEDDVDPAFIASAEAIVVTGTHFSRPNTDAAQRKAIAAAKGAGRRVVFDIDYRPNLWGLAGHAAGEARYVAPKRSRRISDRAARLRPYRRHGGGGPHCRWRGTYAVGSPRHSVPFACHHRAEAGPDGLRSLPRRNPRHARRRDRRPRIPGRGLQRARRRRCFHVGVPARLAARRTPEVCATWANACGAFAVSRLLCSPEIPTWDELNFFLAQGSPHRALRKDAAINHVHWATTRRKQPELLMALAIDHRAQLEAIAERADAPPERIPAFKQLAVRAAARVADGRPGFGMLLDGTYGRDALFDAPS
jgi:5-dehydro-2-deoxygluconokinase